LQKIPTATFSGQEYKFGGEGNVKAKLIPRTRRLLVYSEPQTFRDGYLVLLGSDAPSPLFFGRLVPTADLDVALIRRWLSACEMKHGGRCERPLVSPMKATTTDYPFRVIDVNRMSLVEAPEDCRYIALGFKPHAIVQDHFSQPPAAEQIPGIGEIQPATNYSGCNRLCKSLWGAASLGR